MNKQKQEIFKEFKKDRKHQINWINKVLKKYNDEKESKCYKFLTATKEDFDIEIKNIIKLESQQAKLKTASKSKAKSEDKI